MAFAVTLGLLRGGEPLFWLRQAEFTAPLVVASSALFFVPQGWAKKGLFKFLHYPLPDWDVLLLGPASHRHWLTHSALVPLLLCWAPLRFPLLLNPALPFVPIAVGLCTGIGSHLFWDCVGSRRHSIVCVPYWFTLREAASRLYLLLGAALAIAAAFLLCFAPHSYERLALALQRLFLRD
jgi:hypothetical protein